jgi:ATP-dependent Lon protease
MSEVWQKLISEKYQQPYWFNPTTRESRWEDPTIQQKRPATDRQTTERNESKVEEEQQPLKRQRMQSEEASPKKPHVDIAIIVPFRDLHREQKRLQHLQRFVPEMTR